MDHEHLHPLLAGVVPHGAMRNRQDRPVKNGFWWLASSAGIEPAGWGDLGFGDLDSIAAHLDPSFVFVVVSEQPGMHLATVDHSDPAVPSRPGREALIAALVEDALYAVTRGVVRYVDRYREANRLGAVWIRPGYRLAATGRVIPTRRRRVAATTPADLNRLLRDAVGDGAP